MEIFYATKLQRRRVITICPSDRPSPWLTYWSHQVVRELPAAVVAAAEIIKSEDNPTRKWFVYLAGPINKCTDSECNDWRQRVKAELPALIGGKQ